MTPIGPGPHGRPSPSRRIAEADRAVPWWFPPPPTHCTMVDDTRPVPPRRPGHVRRRGAPAAAHPVAPVRVLTGCRRGRASPRGSRAGSPAPFPTPMTPTQTRRSIGGAVGPQALSTDPTVRLRRRGRRRRRPWVWISALLGLLILGIVGFLVFRLLAAGTTPPVEQVTIPRFVDLTFDQADSEARRIGLTLVSSPSSPRTRRRIRSSARSRAGRPRGQGHGRAAHARHGLTDRGRPGPASQGRIGRTQPDRRPQA